MSSHARDAGATRTVVSAVLDRMTATPDKPCLIFVAAGHVVTYAGLHAASLRFAGGLRAAGVGPRDIVMIFLPTGVDAYAAFLGAMLLGAVPTYMPGPSAKQAAGPYWRDHAALLARTTPRVILTDGTTADAMRASGMLDAHDVAVLRSASVGEGPPPATIAAPAPGDMALLQHSSGTTGLKKGVMLSHAAVVSQVAAYATALGATGDDVVATWLPIYHDMGLISSTVTPLMLGQTIVVLDPFAWVTRPASLFDAISRHRATLVWQPNFAFEHLVRTVSPDDHEVDLSSVRAFVNCSEPCRPETFDRFAARFATLGVRPDQLQVSYAMAETVFAVSQTIPGRPVRRLVVSAVALREEARARPPDAGEASLTLLSNGPPIAGMQVEAVSPQGAVLGEGGVGELVVRGHCLFDGYFRLPDPTRERLSDAGLRTRDVGFVEGGEAFVLGRLDDLVIVHGRNFYAGEIEAAASRVAGVRPGRAVAFGVDNALVGSQDVVVIAEPEAPGGDAAVLSRRIKTAVFQDVGVVVLEARIVEPGWLSKTTSGKISREKNRARYLSTR